MCGIAGIIDPGGTSDQVLWRMADALAHRGPDDATIHNQEQVGLAFRRLSIIDLDGGRQPLSNEDGSVMVVFNGEIYNYRELRADLEKKGHVFSTRTDTETLVHLYEEHGRDLVRQLRGMFAFAIWDNANQKLLLGRDRLGQKPLFWSCQGGRFIFGSEIKALLAADPSLRRLNAEALHEYFTLRIIADPRSMFAGVNKLPPGHTLVLEQGAEPEISRYWSLSFEPKCELNEGEALDRLQDIMRESVEAHLVSDVEVGAFLSGGVDSGLIVGMMSEAVEGSFKTFSGSTPYASFDEAPTARAVSEIFGTEHHETDVTGDLVRLLPRLVHQLDEPSDPLSLCIYRLAELAASNLKVVLGGDGGDELFGGYDRYYASRFADYFALLPSSIRERIVGQVLRRAPDGLWYKSRANRLRWLNELARSTKERRYARSLSYFFFTPDMREELYTQEFMGSVASHDPEAAIMYWQGRDDAGEDLDRMLLADTMVRLPNHPVMIMDRMTMAHGLEARSPLLDHRVAEFAAALPRKMKIRGTQRRYIEMRLAERYLPREIVRRPKQGFSSAVPYLMHRQFTALFRDLLPSARLVEAGILNSEAVERLLREHVSRTADHGNRLWLLLNAELWYRMMIEEDPTEQVQLEVEAAVQGAAAPARPSDAPSMA